MFPRFSLLRLTARLTLLVALVSHLCLPVTAQSLWTLPVVVQERGTLQGKVEMNGASAPASGIIVVATNQVTGRVERERVGAGGEYSMRLPAGAYRVNLEGARAAFDKGGNYGTLASGKGLSVENILIEGGKPTTLNIPLEKPGDKPAEAAVPGGGVETEAGVAAPLGYAGDPSVESALPTRPDRREVRDRWRVGFPEYDRYGSVAGGRDIQFKKGRWFDPYNQNVLKGDYPVFGQDVFFILSAVSTTNVQQQRTPTPSNVSSARPGSSEFFGKPEVLAFGQIFQFSLEMFSGQTSFRPRSWAIKLSPTFSAPNYVRAREQGIINVDPRRGTNRTDWHFSFEDAFVEYKVEDTNANYDFISIRAGIQPFVSDFRGLIYSDNNLGFRTFGAFKNNRHQFNVAYFSQLEKDTNSGLNRFDRRPQNVFIANFFRQDFLTKGYTGQVSFHYNNDRRTIEYDRNGFQVRPAVIGDAREHSVNVGYLGLSGDGHIGRINLTNSYYFALGTDSRNPIAGRKTRVKAHMAFAEASYDKDYQRFKASFLFASGDPNPTDDKANGFDAIFDDPNIIGGQFSFWNRIGIPLGNTNVGLVQPLSVLPSLRSSKIQGQANHVNPGIFIYNLGYDLELTQRIKMIFNFNHLRFHRTEVLEYALFQEKIRHDIGQDYSVGILYRPLLINNIQLTFGASTLRPGRGFRDIFTDVNRNCPPNVAAFCTPDDVRIDPKKPLYALFASVKFVY